MCSALGDLRVQFNSHSSGQKASQGVACSVDSPLHATLLFLQICQGVLHVPHSVPDNLHVLVGILGQLKVGPAQACGRPQKAFADKVGRAWDVDEEFILTDVVLHRHWTKRECP